MQNHFSPQGTLRGTCVYSVLASTQLNLSVLILACNFNAHGPGMPRLANADGGHFRLSPTL